MKTRNFLIISALISIAFLMGSCYKDKNDYNNNSSTASKISISSMGYAPASLTIASGSTVTWTNNDNVVHAVTSTDGTINSGEIAVGSSYSKTFTSVGTFNYYDAQKTSMTGVIIVNTKTSTGGGY